MSDMVTAYRDALNQIKAEQACMLISDLCGSTNVAFNDAHVGAALQAAHEAGCAELAGMKVDSPTFKAMGDGIMMEIQDRRRFRSLC